MMDSEMLLALDRIEDIYVLSPMQQGMLFHSLHAPDTGVYFEQVDYTLHGQIKVEAFAEAWRLLAKRHAALRLSLLWEDVAEPVQIIHRDVDLPLYYEDWRGVSPDDQQLRLQQFLIEDRKLGFDLTIAPLMRLTLFQLSDDCCHFILSQHHLLLDGWSNTLLLKEVLLHYNALRQGSTLTLPPPPPYRNYIEWLVGQDRAQAEAFWREKLRGYAAPTPLPVDADAGQADGIRGYAIRELQLSESATAELRAIVRQRKITFNTL